MILATLLIISLSGGTAVYQDSDHYVRSCSNEPYTIIKQINPRPPLVSSSQGYLSIWGTLHFEINVNKEGSVFTVKQASDSEGNPRAYVKETRRALKRWQFDKSDKAQRCFHVTYVFYKPEIHDIE